MRLAVVTAMILANTILEAMTAHLWGGPIIAMAGSLVASLFVFGLTFHATRRHECQQPKHQERYEAQRAVREREKGGQG